MQTILSLNHNLTNCILKQDEIGFIFEVNRSGDMNRDYTQKIIKKDNVIYLKLGETGERYIFKQIEKSKYIMYLYDYISGKYLTPKTSFFVSHEMKKGNITEQSVAMDEKKVKQYLQRLNPFYNIHGIEDIQLEIVDCEIEDDNTIKFVGNDTFVSQTQRLEIYVDNATGLWKNGLYQSNRNRRINDKRNFHCIVLSKEEIVIPKYELLESSDIAENIKNGIDKILRMF